MAPPIYAWVFVIMQGLSDVNGYPGLIMKHSSVADISRSSMASSSFPCRKLSIALSSWVTINMNRSFVVMPALKSSSAAPRVSSSSSALSQYSWSSSASHSVYSTASAAVHLDIPKVSAFWSVLSASG